jgi:biopolymer transport protein ExbD
MRSRRHLEGDVQLNVAAMLDMAFQLLAFFILTYQPGRVEGCISIRMPPSSPVTRPADASGGGAPTPNDATVLAGAVSLQITLTADKQGGIAAIRVGEQRVADLHDLEQKLRAIAKVSQTPFDQVLLKVSRTLEYENVLKVIDVCARNKLTSGDQQTKVSIVEMP